MRTLVVNFFAGPGAGKSTLAAGLFYKLKQRGINAELVREYAKELVWAGDTEKLSRQLAVSAEQYMRQIVLDGRVPVIVTDSPLLLGCLYHNKAEPLSVRESLAELLQVYFHQSWNLNYFVRREDTYEPAGRIQTAEESRECDARLLRLIKEMGVGLFRESVTRHFDLDTLLGDVLYMLERGEKRCVSPAS